MSNFNNTENIIERLMLAFNVDTITNLAKELGIAQNTISTWKARSIPDKIIAQVIHLIPNLNKHWLLTVEGEPYLSNNNIEVKGDPKKTSSPADAHAPPKAEFVELPFLSLQRWASQRDGSY